jgi:2-dehydropantoate 2-reductase
MRIAVIGAGGVGGAFGAALAKAGADVTFVARGAHLAAMQRTACGSRAGGATRSSAPARRPTTRPASARSIS